MPGGPGADGWGFGRILIVILIVSLIGSWSIKLTIKMTIKTCPARDQSLNGNSTTRA